MTEETEICVKEIQAILDKYHQKLVAQQILINGELQKEIRVVVVPVQEE
jgi:hypothetical protein